MLLTLRYSLRHYIANDILIVAVIFKKNFWCDTLIC